MAFKKDVIKEVAPILQQYQLRCEDSANATGRTVLHSPSYIQVMRACK